MFLADGPTGLGGLFVMKRVVADVRVAIGCATIHHRRQVTRIAWERPTKSKIAILTSAQVSNSFLMVCLELKAALLHVLCITLA